MSACVCEQVAEVWNEVMAELELEGVRPVTPDAEALSTIAWAGEDKAKHISSLQQSILDQKEQEDLFQEKQAYEEVKIFIFYSHVHHTGRSRLLIVVDFHHADQVIPQAARASSQVLEASRC